MSFDSQFDSALVNASAVVVNTSRSISVDLDLQTKHCTNFNVATKYARGRITM